MGLFCCERHGGSQLCLETRHVSCVARDVAFSLAESPLYVDLAVSFTLLEMQSFFHVARDAAYFLRCSRHSVFSRRVAALCRPSVSCLARDAAYFLHCSRRTVFFLRVAARDAAFLSPSRRSMLLERQSVPIFLSIYMKFFLERRKTEQSTSQTRHSRSFERRHFFHFLSTHSLSTFPLTSYQQIGDTVITHELSILTHEICDSDSRNL
ncbi:hypothetical protein K474DRAFT_365138 [Panus rudis PR-1116 ss-1]|nr:hypothetical protein K474DRAFT_365138 [Panus rudis PR-1116 ss-1]